MFLSNNVSEWVLVRNPDLHRRNLRVPLRLEQRMLFGTPAKDYLLLIEVQRSRNSGLVPGSRDSNPREQKKKPPQAPNLVNLLFLRKIAEFLAL